MMNQLSIKQLIDLLRENLSYILLSIVIGLAIGVVYILITKPIYRAELLMIGANDELTSGQSQPFAQFGSVASLAGFNVPSRFISEETAIAVLQSRSFLETFIEEQEIAIILLPKLFDENKKVWKVNEQRLRWTAYREFLEMMTISFDKKTGLVNFRLSWHDPEIVTQWSNQLIEELNDYLREQAIEEANKSIEYLEMELERTNLLNPQNMLYGLIEEQIKKKMLANVRQGYVFKVLDPAKIPDSQIHPRPFRLIALSLFSSALLAILAIFIKDIVLINLLKK